MPRYDTSYARLTASSNNNKLNNNSEPIAGTPVGAYRPLNAFRTYLVHIASLIS